jgi:hypothetical protein
MRNCATRLAAPARAPSLTSARVSPTIAFAFATSYFTDADNSLHETIGAVDLALAIDALDAADADVILALAVPLRAMLRGLRKRA